MGTRRLWIGKGVGGRFFIPPACKASREASWTAMAFSAFVRANFSALVASAAASLSVTRFFLNLASEAPAKRLERSLLTTLGW